MARRLDRESQANEKALPERRLGRSALAAIILGASFLLVAACGGGREDASRTSTPHADEQPSSEQDVEPETDLQRCIELWNSGATAPLRETYAQSGATREQLVAVQYNTDGFCTVSIANPPELTGERSYGVVVFTESASRTSYGLSPSDQRDIRVFEEENAAFVTDGLVELHDSSIPNDDWYAVYGCDEGDDECLIAARHDYTCVERDEECQRLHADSPRHRRDVLNGLTCDELVAAIGVPSRSPEKLEQHNELVQAVMRSKGCPPLGED